ncbi:unnamed protein product, partial [Closterium sp. NIES-53]
IVVDDFEIFQPLIFIDSGGVRPVEVQSRPHGASRVNSSSSFSSCASRASASCTSANSSSSPSPSSSRLRRVSSSSSPNTTSPGSSSTPGKSTSKTSSCSTSGTTSCSSNSSTSRSSVSSGRISSSAAVVGREGLSETHLREQDPWGGGGLPEGDLEQGRAAGVGEGQSSRGRHGAWWGGKTACQARQGKSQGRHRE